MSTAPSLSALRSSKHSGGGGGGGSSSGSADPAWTSALSGNCSGHSSGSSPAGSTKPFVHAVPPSDPLRQANRLPIKVLKMLTARTGHILHPEYLQPLPSTPVSPIEVRTFFPGQAGTPTRPAFLRGFFPTGSGAEGGGGRNDSAPGWEKRIAFPHPLFGKGNEMEWDVNSKGQSHPNLPFLYYSPYVPNPPPSAARLTRA